MVIIPYIDLLELQTILDLFSNGYLSTFANLSNYHILVPIATTVSDNTRSVQMLIQIHECFESYSVVLAVCSLCGRILIGNGLT
ncbi:hypothetical protein C6497_08495 [Candidatus Poribacteria bacterium]|nr:MAG: hypothetical protein C6497_08495 [Candidatus Poribacteria bacterium]